MWLCACARFTVYSTIRLSRSRRRRRLRMLSQNHLNLAEVGAGGAATGARGFRTVIAPPACSIIQGRYVQQKSLNLGRMVRPGKRGRFCHKTVRDESSQGRIILEVDHPRNAASHFFLGRIVQGRFVRAPYFTLALYKILCILYIVYNPPHTKLIYIGGPQTSF
jgi:hypothetical protein